MIEKLSLKERYLKLQLDEINDQDKEKNSENLKRAVLGDIHHRVKVLKVKEIENHLPKIGRTKNDSTSMFQVIKHIKRLKPKFLLLIETDTR